MNKRISSLLRVYNTNTHIQQCAYKIMLVSIISFCIVLPKSLSQCESLFGVPPTLSITTNAPNGIAAYPGCSIVTYCFTVFNGDNQLTAIPIAFTNTSDNGEVMLIGVSTPGFIETVSGTFTGTFNFAPYSITEFCLSFQVDPTFTIEDNFRISATVTITHPACPAAETATFNNFFPTLPNAIVNGSASLANLSSPGGPLLDPQTAQSFGQDVLINGQLIVDRTEYHFSQNSRIIMGPGASIVLFGAINSLLHIDNEAQVFGCNGVWDRIEIEEGATLSIEGSGNNVLIRDGENGIQMNNGATLNTSNVTFLNNQKAITNKTNGSDLTTLNFGINGPTTITSDAGMLSPYTGEKSGWGMLLTNAQFNLIGNGGNTITFSDLKRGIDLRACNATIERMYFRDLDQWGIKSFGFGLNRTLTYKGHGLGGFGFEGLPTGIMANDMNLDISNTSMRFISQGIEQSRSDRRFSKIYENEIIARRTGVGLFSNLPANLEVKDNEITIHDDTSPSSSSTGIGIRADENFNGMGGFFYIYRFFNNLVKVDNAQTGIWVQSGTFPRLTKNTIDLLDPNRETYFGINMQGSSRPIALCNEVNGNGSPANWRSAVAFNNEGLSDARIRCNEVKNSDVGFNFDNLGDATSLTGNLVNEHRLGLQITSNAAIGDQEHNGNQWLGTAYGPPGIGGLNGNFGGFNQSNPIFSQFLVDENENSVFNTSVNVANWFVDDPTPESSYYCTTSNTCPNGIGSDIDEFTGEGPKKIDVLDYTIANGGFVADTCSSEVNWTGKRHLYRRLMADPSLYANDPAMQAFVNTESLTTVGQFHNMETNIANLFLTDSLTEDQLALQQGNILTELSALYSIDSTLAVGGLTPSQVQALLQQKVAHQSTLVTETASNDSLVSSVTSNRATQAQQLAATNAAISATTAPEINERTVNEIFLETVAADIDTFTTAQIASLLSIAQECPPCGGDAVYRARSMYALIDPSVEFGGIDCYEVGQRSDNEGESLFSISSFSLAPNPASNEVKINMEKGADNVNRTIALYSVTGTLMEKQPIQPNQSLWKIDTSKFPAGAYYIVIYDDDEKVFAEQLMIVK